MRMEIIIRGKHIFGTSKNKSEMILCLQETIKDLKTIPEEATLQNNGDDYLTFYITAKDKDDYKYFRKLGFRKMND